MSPHLQFLWRDTLNWQRRLLADPALSPQTKVIGIAASVEMAAWEDAWADWLEAEEIAHAAGTSPEAAALALGQLARAGYLPIKGNPYDSPVSPEEVWGARS